VHALIERYELPIRLRNAVERMLLDIQRLEISRRSMSRSNSSCLRTPPAYAC
jgi:hypothetical protein